METHHSEGNISPEKTLKQKYPLIGMEKKIGLPGQEKLWNSEWFLSEYVNLTDTLIGRMDGTIPLEKEKVFRRTPEGLVEEKKDYLAKPDAVIYLDKSARPVEWLVRRLWPTLARTPDSSFDEGEIPPMPNSHFLNIDKGIWLTRMGVPEHQQENAPASMIDVTKIDPELITRIRALYSTANLDESTLEDAWNHPTLFDNRHVMIVDEVKSSGRTLDIAKQLLAYAIPEATFSGQYWSEPGRVITGKDKDGKDTFYVEWAPVWYDQHQASGRGIGDLNPQWPEIAQQRGYHVSNVGQIGRYVLSTPTHAEEGKEVSRMNAETGKREIFTIAQYDLVPDKKAQELRDEIKQIPNDLSDHKIFYRPSRFREDDDIDARIESLTGLTYDEWVKRVNEIKPKSLR